ncbi:MAG: hypothetical protein NC548_37810 [Lachnospiraceae bacterium]|nr:hypothetical protein [Lachnospiraceae bacterium]MCM1233011.1 hypothetical protein [Ruminococcus flavefaciens]
MVSTCKICNHPERAAIENAILALTTSGSGSVEDIATQFDVPLDELKMHAMFHTPLVSDADIKAIELHKGEEPEDRPRGDSLTRKMGLREADILATVANEYLVTMKTMGRRINKLAQVSSIDEEDQAKQLQLAKLLTKPMVDLYVGMGSEIRQTVKTMGELDRMLNGPEDSANQGLSALAAAIRQSDGA